MRSIRQQLGDRVLYAGIALDSAASGPDVIHLHDFSVCPLGLAGVSLAAAGGVQRAADTVCPYCGVGCTLTVHVQDDRIVKIGSPLESSVTRGNLCVKGRFGFEYVHIDKS